MIEDIRSAIAAIPYPQRPEGLYEPIAYVMSMGGKRLRPMLMLLCYSVFRTDWQNALPAATALELYHNHTLLHDDLMDHADVRRGKPTVHRRWDENTAILSGDTMLLMAARQMAQQHIGRHEEANECFLKSAIEICEGQQYDVNFEKRHDVTEEEYIEMIRLKTSVLLGCAAKIGALLAGASDKDCNILYAFAEKIGLAFQLQDDCLDCFGNEQTFGKRIGGDILCGKKTFMTVAAMQRMENEADRKAFLSILDATADTPEAERKKIDLVIDIYRKLGIAEVADARIQQCYDEAHRILLTLDADTATLWNYATSLLGRES